MILIIAADCLYGGLNMLRRIDRAKSVTDFSWSGRLEVLYMGKCERAGQVDSSYTLLKYIT